jgi:hypothetical protein
LREEEDETSYIDMIALRIRQEDGQVVLLQTPHRVLSARDGERIVLNRNDEVTIQFPDVEISREQSREILISGYYVPKAAILPARRRD